MTLSVFDIFKIGIGPSSSHTMGPMRAACEFVQGLEKDGLLAATQEIAVRLYGSLALTGLGHGTDRAILLGLEGADAESVDPDQMEPAVARIRASGRINLLGRHEVPFDEPMQLLFMRHERLERHSNGMRFSALGAQHQVLREEDYFSIGGGFIVRGDETPVAPAGVPPAPYPFDSGDELLLRCREQGLEIFEIVLANERRLAHRRASTRGTHAHVGGHAGLCCARISPDRAAARRAEGAAARAETVPHADRGQSGSQAARCHGLGERLGAGGE